MKNRLNLKSSLASVPTTPGVYVMHDIFNKTLYIGKAKNLKKRISSYFRPSTRYSGISKKIITMLDLVYGFKFYSVKSESEALLLESQLIKKHKPPYNTKLKDNKKYMLIQINLNEDLPKLILTRLKRHGKFKYYGPFPYSKSLKETLQFLKFKYGIILKDSSPKKVGDQWLLYNDARAELYDLPNLVTKKDYTDRLNNACRFLEGETKQIIFELENKMNNFSAKKEYEKAANIRDRINDIKRTLLKTKKFDRNLIGRVSSKESIECLRKELGYSIPLKVIECFDISHISGTFCVGSMVQFKDGKPYKKNYRHYKIRSFIGNNDYKAIEEITFRRYLKLKKEKKEFPNLIVIDGGIGQVTAALKSLKKLGLKNLNIIGLAKKNEAIFKANCKKPISLPLNNNGLRLLQYIRDEAHRFANNLSSRQRIKQIKNSFFDKLPGIGENKRIDLLNKFGSIEKIKRLNYDDLIKINGIGDKIAQKLIKYLSDVK